MDLQKLLQGAGGNIQNLEGLNPLELLGKIGLNELEAQTVMNGNFSPVTKTAPDILDFNLIMEYNGDYCNANLINYFFKKAKMQEAFTEEESAAYLDAWENWFVIVFKVAQRSIFQMSEKLDDMSLIIKKGEDHFHMTIFGDIKQINYLGNRPLFQ